MDDDEDLYLDGADGLSGVWSVSCCLLGQSDLVFLFMVAVMFLLSFVVLFLFMSMLCSCSLSDRTIKGETDSIRVSGNAAGGWTTLTTRTHFIQACLCLSTVVLQLNFDRTVYLMSLSCLLCLSVFFSTSAFCLTRGCIICTKWERCTETLK